MKMVQRLLATALGGIALFFGALWLDHRSETTLPTPTGPYAVGRLATNWSEVAVWIWYPAATGHSMQAEEYLPAAWREADNRLSGVLIGRFLNRDLAKVHAHSLRNADISPARSSYPVAILRGGASANVVYYSVLAEDLASHGYVVVGFDARGRTRVVVTPDGRAIARSPANDPETCTGPCLDRLLASWTRDIGFALDQLTILNTTPGRFEGRLDMNRIGVFGHSFGGAQAAQFCHDDARCKAGIDIDGAPLGTVVQAGMKQPFLFLLSAQVESSDPESLKIKADIQSIYARLPPNGRMSLEIRGSNHFLFGDDGAFLKNHLIMGALRTLHIVGLDGPRQQALTAYCIRTFFDHYLTDAANAGASPLQIASPAYPEIKVLP